ncbi:MAG: bifunctional riboflavin kinase/FAD synthetase [Clostridia bacterium]|nr:bifunctional riboflavin kinase/FAD synthetase [Clostridia bacterium]
MIKLGECEKLNNTSVCIGNFDGVHMAHRALIKMADDEKENLKSVIYTFSPHPKKVFGMNIGFIQSEDEKKETLMETECDYLFLKEATREFLGKSPMEFVREELVGRLGAKKVFVGYDFKFGKNSGGDAALLSELGKEYGFSVHILPEMKISDIPVKSSSIRHFIEDGDFYAANLLLGRLHSYEGEIVHGKRLGRNLGFPTANIFPGKEKVLPPFGVYAAKAEVEGETYNAVVNVGINPTVEDGKNPKMEINIMDFDKDIYGKRIKISFFRIIRREKKFGNIDELKYQIEKDVKNAKKCLTNC